MRISRGFSRSLRVAQIVLCILATSVSLLASSQHLQKASVQPAKRGRMAAISPDMLPEIKPDGALSFTLHPQVKTFVDAWVEYNPTTCAEISAGSWAVTTAPTYGTTATGTVTGTLGNGDCPGTNFTFAAIYYTWTSAQSAVSTDSFAATWTSPDYTEADTVAITVIAPVNFAQVGAGVAKPGGVLHFDYTWASTSGNLPDLSQCEVGEHVVYPGASPYPWPSPPYVAGSTNNPTITWVAATKGKGEDNHSHLGFLKPYVAAAFTATQDYRYKCKDLDITNFPGYSGIAITRTVADSTGKGCWGYTITKSGASASVPRLPGVTAKECAAVILGDALDLAPDNVSGNAREPMLDSTNSGGKIDLSVSLHEASTGLHAPIFFDLTVSNRSAAPVGFDLGLNQKANLELTITDPAGAVTTRKLSSEGFGASGEGSLAPGGSFAERLLLNEWYEFSATGTYGIKMTLLDDSSVTGETDRTDRPSAEFSVKIGPRDPAQLERISQELADKAIRAATLEESMEAANALSYIRDPLAVDSLTRVLQQGTLVEHYAVDGLGRIASPEAIAALEAAQDHPDEDVRAAVRSMLDRLQGRDQGDLRPVD